MTENEISETLERGVPHCEVPAGLLAGARLRRRRTRSLTGVAALALVAAVAVPLGLAMGGLIPGGSGFGSEDLHGGTAVLSLPLDGTPHTGDVATASSRIAWNLMVADDEVRATNTVIDPSSLAVTLAMLAEGATVAEGDTVAVLEAMKMESNITAHRAGSFTPGTQEPGAAIGRGDVLGSIA